jgi:hypothetical protein
MTPIAGSSPIHTTSTATDGCDLERDDIRLNRRGILHRSQIRFNLLAGMEASRNGEALLERSA